MQVCQYYHRTMASEMMGIVYGAYGGSAKTLQPGGLTCDNAYVPHGGIVCHFVWYIVVTDIHPQKSPTKRGKKPRLVILIRSYREREH